MKHVFLAISLLVFIGPIRAQQRFDFTVRNDFFAGFAGNKEAFARGMKICEDILAKGNDPQHAEALVWHGGGTFFQSGQVFQAGDLAKGQQLWEFRRSVNRRRIGLRLRRCS